MGAWPSESAFFWGSKTPQRQRPVASQKTLLPLSPVVSVRTEDCVPAHRRRPASHGAVVPGLSQGGTSQRVVAVCRLMGAVV